MTRHARQASTPSSLGPIIRPGARRFAAADAGDRPGGSRYGRIGGACLVLLFAAFLLLPATEAAAGTIKVELLGSGDGTVTSSPAGINCSNVGQAPGPSCESSFGDFSFVFLSATASAMSTFTGWTAEPPSTQCPDATGNCGGFGFAFGGRTVTATFDALLPPPTVTIEPATDVGSSEATFHGSVNPNGNPASWRFEYRPVGASDWSKAPVPDGDAGSGETAEPVEATAEGLEANTEYEVRLRAANATTPATSGVETFQTLAAPPDVDTGRAFSISDTTATLTGTVDPNNAALTDCRFEYGTDESYGQEASCSPGLAAIENADEVQQVTVRATRGTFQLTFDGKTTANIPFDAPAATVQSQLRSLASIGSPNVSVSGGPGDESGSHPYVVTFEAALGSRDVEPLTADIDGMGISGEGIALGTISPGGFPVRVTADVSGLAPETTYHFRLVAGNECEAGCGAAEGTDAAFATRSPVVFPQRGHELVSAFDTNGVKAWPELGAASGNHYAYDSGVIPMPGSENGAVSFFRSSRNPDGSWSQRFVGAPHPRPGDSDAAAGSSGPLYSPNDLSQVAWGARTAVDPEDENSARDSYLRDAGDGSIAWLSCTPAPPARVCPPSGEDGPGHADDPQYVSPDGSRVLFASSRRLLPEDIASGSNRSLYAWDKGRLDLVGIAPGGSEGLPGGSTLGSVANRRGTGGENAYGNDVAGDAVSRDGSRIAFQSGAGATSQRLYVRLGDSATVEASASAPGAPAIAAPKNVNYWGADADLQSVFFSSASPLTADSSAPDTTINPDTRAGSADLYRYVVPADGDPAHGQLIDLTPHPGGAGVTQVLSVSDDGRRLYFLANGALTAGAQPGDCYGVALSVPFNTMLGRKCNLYLAELGGPGDPVALTLIAHSAITLGRAVTAGGGAFSRASEKLRQAVANPTGSILAFLSADALVPGRQSGGHSQVYLYDAAREELGCVSCPAGGSIPPAPASLTTLVGENGTPFGFNGTPNNGVPHMRNVSADGTAVYFQTASPLVAADANGKRDVYEHRGGKLRLISTAGHAEAVFGDAAADGSTVFFVTASKVLRGIEAGVARVYAARVGVPDWQPLPPEPPCTGEDCKPVATGQPNYSAPSTSTVLGRGNVLDRPDCRRPARQAQRLARRARGARRNAGRLLSQGRRAPAVKLRRKARRFAIAAKRRSEAAGRCRGAARRAAR